MTKNKTNQKRSLTRALFICPQKPHEAGEGTKTADLAAIPLRAPDAGLGRDNKAKV